MPSKNKLIKQGIKYTDSLFDEISKRLEKGVKASDTLEAFLEKTAGYTSGNPLVESGYYDKMMKLILQETNNHKFSRPAQKELVRLTIENRVGDLIVDVGEDIRDNVRDIVKDGYNSNLSQDEIATNISNKVSAIKSKRAKAIARTEIARTATVSDYIINKERGATHFYVECRNTACPICKEAWHKHWSKANDESFTPRDSSAGGKGWIGDRTYSMKDTAMLPPIHPNCRCVPYFISEEDIPEGITVEKPTPKQTTSNLTDEDMEKRLSADEFKQYKELKSMINFSEGLLKRGRLEQSQIDYHTQFVQQMKPRLEEWENKARNSKPKSVSIESAEVKSTPTTVDDGTYHLNNRENSFSDVVIEEKHLKPIIDFQLKRANNKIEYGNCILLNDASLYHQTDVRGKKHGVVCRRPNVGRDFAFVHNHPGESNATFSGADMRNQLEYSNQKIAIATTKEGIWIARDTEYGTHAKKENHITANTVNTVMSGMNAKVNEFAKPIYEEKYKPLLENAKDKKEFNKIKEEYRKEYIAQYNDWVLETYGVGKNKYNYFEIEFIPNEELNNVQF